MNIGPRYSIVSTDFHWCQWTKVRFCGELLPPLPSPPFLVLAWVHSLEEPTSFLPFFSSLFYTYFFPSFFLSYSNFFLPQPFIIFSSSIFSFLFPFFPLFFLPLSAAFLSSIYYSPGCFLLSCLYFPFSPFNHYFFSPLC